MCKAKGIFLNYDNVTNRYTLHVCRFVECLSPYKKYVHGVYCIYYLKLSVNKDVLAQCGQISFLC